ncbi:hypothetical protein FJV76_29325 [Mesorhizobium sp. WSM4303]|uniref:hypothetical protein n=1 Tax=unclassified Mesorhizobium TaxID=325217 RepID=UPI00115F6523|nr:MULTISPECIES: hypothetical protein [unclassified Mesorhizobium]TRC92187.1 hypothetical protein FJV77_25910 [Mesorhizobium sp. WSM4306]TRC95575.1 hypothetical protein FJV76_29325 [Mesorhizobium sp. WSM4303]
MTTRSCLSKRRKKLGLIVLKTVHDEAHVTALLTSAGQLPINLAEDKAEIEKALERYIAAGKAAEFDV